LTVEELHNMECELVAQREQMAAKQREHMEEKEKLKRLKVLSGTLFAAVLRIHDILEWIWIPDPRIHASDKGSGSGSCYFRH
jgi:hypothetical protein